MHNSILAKLALAGALSVLPLSTTFAAITFQQDVEAEQVETMSTAKVPSQRYGSWLFNGAFSQHSFSATNPEYRLTQGDTLIVQVWGAINHQAEVVVDPQGNIFIPKVGPIKVLGVSNAKLNEVIFKSVQRVYQANVEVYASLMSSQKVKVFLSGMVNQPGLYEGQSADSVLRFIDQASGIRDDIGSYRNIQVKRNGRLVQQLDLYQFLQSGTLPPMQLQDGDVIFVGPKQGEITLEGEVGFQGYYELLANGNKANPLKPILDAVVAGEQATHVTIVAPEAGASSAGNRRVNATQYQIEDAGTIQVSPGALVKVTAQLRPNSISIDLIGEHDSAQEMVLPWGASLQDLLDQTQFTRLSNQSAVQLYRESVAERQYEMLQASLSALEQSVLNTRSNTREAAELRAAEAEVILRWIEKARQVQPKGQVLLSESSDFSQIILQQGDKVVIPAKRNLVIVHGEVMFPTAIAYRDDLSVLDLINKAGGANQELDEMNILVMKPNGSFVTANKMLKKRDVIAPGDEIFVLSKPDEKSMQFAKDITQIIFQVAMSAAVVLSI
ncbi:polysaccharide export protein [Ferrimonas balearica DSM 9799]|uniref:Polysaccharide export protein n=1 Tax=Ferrimonas balearica (strain DSM 9799 / CCM 4581 / KCTC 23876 / PAT) TaxID=550540 RepID=E1SP13_FERBD|nr:polysaccharide biosynthesis/export family protein [Ferrimonas balearica]ADN74662.1 polysaccharide export protein [Ferrimonas balearica DSM 9799]